MYTLLPSPDFIKLLYIGSNNSGFINTLKGRETNTKIDFADIMALKTFHESEQGCQMSTWPSSKIIRARKVLKQCSIWEIGKRGAWNETKAKRFPITVEWNWDFCYLSKRKKMWNICAIFSKMWEVWHKNTCQKVRIKQILLYAELLDKNIYLKLFLVFCHFWPQND